MPKKLGTCPKALEARERRAEKKKEERERAQKQIEDEYWKDEDKLVSRKQQRKEERDSKRQEQLEKKKEKEKMYEEEINSIKGAKGSADKSQPSKLTQAQIAAARAKLSAQLASLSKPVEKNEPEELPENPNRIEVDGLEARCVDDAISILKLNDNASDGDRHPERRIKAAYVAYEETMLPRLRAENPSLKHSQLKQMVFKMFQTAPENPKNQSHATYNAK